MILELLFWCRFRCRGRAPFLFRRHTALESQIHLFYASQHWIGTTCWSRWMIASHWAIWLAHEVSDSPFEGTPSSRTTDHTWYSFKREMIASFPGFPFFPCPRHFWWHATEFPSFDFKLKLFSGAISFWAGSGSFIVSAFHSGQSVWKNRTEPQ